MSYGRTVSETLSGRPFDFANPRPEMIDLGDVATGLSQVCRFAGQLSRFHSVAEHSCHVRQLVIEAGYPELGLPALLHDGHEAYTGDIPSPMKARLDELAPAALDAIVLPIDEAIAARFGIGTAYFHHPAVKEADRLALRMEAAALKDARVVNTAEGWVDTVNLPGDWSPGLAPADARQLFLDAYEAEVAARAARHADVARGWGRQDG